MTDTTSPTGDIAAALAAAAPHALVIEQHADDHLIVAASPSGIDINYEDLERYLPAPVRQRGTVKALTADGFTALFDQLTRPDTPATVYADLDRTRLIAVLNDDIIDAAGWRDFRLTYEPQLTPAWRHWVGHARLTDQEAFALALEEGETEIVNPSATVMLDIAQSFHASTSAKFKQGGRLRDGRTQLTYEEEIEASAGEGLVEIPESFTIEVAPFYGAQPVAVQCRLRYRITRGDLTIGYTIHRPDEIVRTSFETDVMATVATALGDHLVVAATPADPLAAGR